MAAKKEAGCGCAIAEMPPSLYLNFDDPDEVEGVNVGDEVTVIIHGKVTGVSQRESKSYSSASVDLERYDVKIKEGNIFKELMKDEA